MLFERQKKAEELLENNNSNNNNNNANVDKNKSSKSTKKILIFLAIGLRVRFYQKQGSMILKKILYGYIN